MLLALGTTGILSALSGNATHQTQRLINYTKAQVYAEAGFNDAYNKLKSDFSLCYDNNAFPPTQMENGGYDTMVTPIDEDTVTIVSIGYSGNATATIKVDIKNLINESASRVPRSSPYAYTLFVNGDITHNGVSDVKALVQCNGELVANGDVTWGDPIEASVVYSVRINGGNGYVDGTIRSPLFVGSGTDDENIKIKIVEVVPLVYFPVLYLDDYYNHALENGQVFPGGTYSGDLDIQGGVRWFKGDVVLKSVTYSGCIIATGNIIFNGGVIQTKVDNLPAVISRDSYIRFNGSRDIHGLVYSKGDLLFNGEGTTIGTVIVGGNCTFNGKSGVLAYEYCRPSPKSSGFDDENSWPVITAWQK